MGLVNSTGSNVSIDRGMQYPDTVGVSQGDYLVEETGGYHNADYSESIQLNAGDRIPFAMAMRLGLVSETEIVEGTIVEGNPLEGEKIAAQLRAAGYDLGEAKRPEVDPDAVYVETVATDGLDLVSGDTGTASDEPKWFQAIKAKAEADGNEVTPREDGETEAAYRDRIKDAEPVRTNENAPDENR